MAFKRRRCVLQKNSAATIFSSYFFRRYCAALNAPPCNESALRSGWKWIGAIFIGSAFGMIGRRKVPYSFKEPVKL
jgi:hypothetical protein